MTIEPDEASANRDLSLRLSAIRSNLGDEIPLPPTGVTCVVGANNVGKSQLLADVRRHLLQNPDGQPVVLAGVTTSPSLPFEDATLISFGTDESSLPRYVVDFLRSRSGAISADQSGAPTYAPKGHAQFVTARQFFNGIAQSRLNEFVAPWLISDANIGASVNYASSNLMNPGTDSSLFSMALRSWEIEQQISDLFGDGFDQPLVLDTVASGGFRIGHDDKSLLVGHRPTDAYRDQIASLPKLSAQGNGVQAYMAVAASLQISDADIFILDEPETYLHPPQARALGRLVGRLSVERRFQVILATHDRDFIVGLIESGCPLNFVRVTREGDGNRLHHVDTAEVSKVWGSAILRYSNVLDGLFYRKVVVCEAEPDCRFYGAVLDGLVGSGDVSRRDSECLFLSSSGKGGMVRRVEALSSLKCDIAVVVDFDILKDGAKLIRPILRALGREWRPEWLDAINIVKQDIADNKLGEVVKRAGLSALSSGRARQAAEVVIGGLAGEGLFVIRTGALESFYAGSAQEKERWVDEMLESGRHLEVIASRDFVASVVAATAG